MKVDLESIKQLRNNTGAGMVDCKKALEESGGDIEKAVVLLRKKGILKAGSKSDRITHEGLIESYIHQNGRLGALVEINCETDFVARTEVFKDLAHTIAIQVASMNPLYISKEDVPDNVKDKEIEIIKSDKDFKSKPENVRNTIIEGRLAKYYLQVCLLDQPCYKDDKVKIIDLINNAISKTGENIKIRRFTRFEIGEEDGY
ncbi:MAG: translation elongation factor Ts [Patescibacteria group bacterium]